MPSKSKAQYKLFEIASYNKEFAEKRHMDQKVAREWHEEDKKKRKEDPEWYDNLPEKAEEKEDKDDKKSKPAKKKGHDKESMESMLLDLVSIMRTQGSFESAEVAGELIDELYVDQDQTDLEVTDCLIDNSYIYNLLRFPVWPKNVLDGIEKGLTSIAEYFAAPDSAMPQIGGLGNLSVSRVNEDLEVVSTPVPGPSHIPALSKNGVAKAGKLMSFAMDLIKSHGEKYKGTALNSVLLDTVRALDLLIDASVK